MDAANLEDGSSAVNRVGQPGDVIVECNRRHTTDLGIIYPHDKNGRIADAPGMRVFFGSVHDRGIIGAPQAELTMPPAIWRGCMQLKAIKTMMSKQHIRVIGTV